MAHKAGHIEDWYKDQGMGGSWEDSPDAKGIGDSWDLPDEKDEQDSSGLPYEEYLDLEKEEIGKFDWFPGVRDYITDDLLDDLQWGGSKTFDTVTDMEWDKIIANSVLNSPEMLKDLAWFWPQMGMEGLDVLRGGKFDWPLKNKPWIPYEKSNKYKEGEGMLAEEIAMEVGSGLGAFQLYNLLYDRAPEMAKTVARKWMPWTHGISTTFGSDLKNYYRKIKKPIKLTKGAPQKVLSSIKNALWSPGTARSLGQGAVTGGIGTFLSTLLHSKPAYGALDDPGGPNYQGSYADQIRDNIDFSARSPSLIPDSDPVIYDDYMQEKIQNFKPTPKGPGPWNEFEG